MQKLLVVALLALNLCSGTAQAGETPLYQNAPDWVVPASMPDNSVVADDQLQAVVVDTQIRIQDGQVWTYGEFAQRVISADALNKMGSVVLQWWPDHGDLIIHGVDIIRAGQRINVLENGPKFTVLRREANLENLMLDGLLTATLAVEGLRVGDILDLRYSSTSRDTTLKGNVAASAGLVMEPIRVGFGRVRALWQDKEPIRWKIYPHGAISTETQDKGWHELNLKMPIPKQPDAAASAPGRYSRPASVEFSSFPDWRTVSAIMAPLYVTDGLIQPGGSLDQEVRQIAASTADPKLRTAMALQLVQNKVRYFLKAMDGGNYVPQAPEQTWANRYGDCKAKTLLLLSILHQLGIDAEPVFAHLGNGDLIPERLPSISAFNHVLVLAHVNQQDLYLDGTSLGAMPEDLDDVPTLYWVLPVRSGGADLLKVPHRFPARPAVEIHASVDMRGGIYFAAPAEAEFIFRGPLAGMLNTSLAKLDKEGREKLLIGAISRTPLFGITTVPTFNYDEARSTATISVSGIYQQGWSHTDDRYSFDPVGFTAVGPPDRSRAIWKDIPVYIPPAPTLSGTLTFRLPDHGRDFSLEGDAARQLEIPGNRRYSYNAVLEGDTLKVDYLQAQAGGEITGAELPELRKKIAELGRHALKVRSSQDYPAWWVNLERAKRAHLYDPALKVFDEAVAAKSDDARRYLARAGFLVSILERERAMADLTKALTIQADKQTYRERAELYRELGQYPESMRDLQSALDLDPADTSSIAGLARLEALTGQFEPALARMDAAIDNGGKQEADLVQSKAEILFFANRTEEALDAITAAIEKWPRNASLFNMRCWLHGIANTDLEAGLKDCAHAIELGDQVTSAALDSRAMIYYRQGRYDEAQADLKAALDANPGQPGSLFMQAMVEHKLGRQADSERDLTGARLIDPRVDEEYARYGVKWPVVGPLNPR